MSLFMESQVWISESSHSLATSHISFSLRHANSIIAQVVIDIKQKHFLNRQTSKAYGLLKKNHLQNKIAVTEVHSYNIWSNHLTLSLKNQRLREVKYHAQDHQLIKSKSLHSQSSISANILLSSEGKIGPSFFNL